MIEGSHVLETRSLTSHSAKIKLWGNCPPEKLQTVTGTGPLINWASVYPSLVPGLRGPPPQPISHKRTLILYSHKNEKSLPGSEVNEFCATNRKCLFFPPPTKCSYQRKGLNHGISKVLSFLLHRSVNLTSWFTLTAICHWLWWVLSWRVLWSFSGRMLTYLAR